MFIRNEGRIAIQDPVEGAVAAAVAKRLGLRQPSAALAPRAEWTTGDY